MLKTETRKRDEFAHKKFSLLWLAIALLSFGVIRARIAYSQHFSLSLFFCSCIHQSFSLLTTTSKKNEEKLVVLIIHPLPFCAWHSGFVAVEYSIFEPNKFCLAVLCSEFTMLQIADLEAIRKW